MKVLLRQRDLSDDYLRFAVQIGADGIDIHNAGLQMDHLPHSTIANVRPPPLPWATQRRCSAPSMASNSTGQT